MALSHDTVKRAEAYGWYTSYASDANDVMNQLSGDLESLQAEEPNLYWRDGMKVFKVTVIVEEQD